MRRRIAVIGGGPGGLYLARLLRRQTPAPDVTVFERNAPDSTFGFGVAFSPATLEHLAAADAETHAEIIGASVGWDGMLLRLQDREVRWRDFGLRGIRRTVLLSILQARAREVGARLEFEREVSLSELADYEVVVAADGANSRTRHMLAADVGTTVGRGLAKYMWVGTTGPFDRITFCVRCDEAGTFAIHAYPHAAGAATMVIETDERSWRRAGLERFASNTAAPGRSDLGSVRYLERVFAADLQGHRILVNNSKWLNFPTVRNARWWSGHSVLLGDAAHTAHPSVASGTKLAMEDAIVLAEELAGSPDLAGSFQRYQQRRQPDVEHVQRRAELSRRWWETLRWRTGMMPQQLGISYLTRAGAVDYAKLERVAPELTGTENGDGPLRQPVRVGTRTLAGRVLDDDVVVLAGAGDLVLRLARERAARPDALLAVELADAMNQDAVALAVRWREAGADLIALPRGAAPEIRELAERIRLERGLLVLERCVAGELGRAATDIAAGRIDIVGLARSGAA